MYVPLSRVCLWMEDEPLGYGCTFEGGVYVPLAGVYVPCKVESLDLSDGGVPL